MSKPGFPQPPKSNRTAQDSSGDLSTASKPLLEQALDNDAPSGRLGEDETAFILRTCLLPEHREDPNVLRFISNYMRSRDAKQAAKEAGLDPRSGPNLRARPDIHNAIDRLTQKSVMKYGFDASEVIERVKEIAGVDPVDFLNPDGTYKTDMREIPPEARRAIKRFKAKNLFDTDPNGMKVVVGVLIEVEFCDKTKGIELLGREKDLFVEKKKVEHDVSQNMAGFLLESTKRADDRINQLKDVSPVLAIEGKRIDE